MPLINCESHIDLNWCKKYLMVATAVVNQGATFSITVTKLYLHVVTLLTQDNAKLLDQLKSGFKKQLTGMNAIQKYQLKDQTNIFRLILV